MKKTQLICVGCNRRGGVARDLEGHRVLMCDECWPDVFRREYVIAVVTGVPRPCKCGLCTKPGSDGAAA